MLKYGGGHESAGTCQIENDDAERVLSELVGQTTADGQGASVDNKKVSIPKKGFRR
jgi:nanoRNase/pAp phosphatase (c-di-AMP/oligoRNAs hydrolase)